MAEPFSIERRKLMRFLGAKVGRVQPFWEMVDRFVEVDDIG